MEVEREVQENAFDDEQKIFEFLESFKWNEIFLSVRNFFRRNKC